MTSAAQQEQFVIKRGEEALQVYSLSSPSQVYAVGGTVDEPTCTCPEFEALKEGEDPDGSCRHIIAVFERSKSRSLEATHPAPTSKLTPPRTRPRAATSATNGSPSTLTLKRSISPDGRIDSLSVEVTCPVDDAAGSDVHRRAVNALMLQSEIIGTFLEANGNKATAKVTGNGQESPGPVELSDGSVSAKLLSVSGMDTRWGRRLFISVQVNGDQLKFFGSAKHLSDAMASIGYGDRVQALEEGVKLELPCRVITKRSPDGRYVNVDQLLPPNGNGRRG